MKLEDAGTIIQNGVTVYRTPVIEYENVAIGLNRERLPIFTNTKPVIYLLIKSCTDESGRNPDKLWHAGTAENLLL